MVSLLAVLTLWLSIPITTKSDEARKEYLAGRTLVENLRNTDAIPHFQRAIALDPGFAIAHLALSNVSPTATEFQSERALAVKYIGNASEAEQLLIRAAEAGRFPFDGTWCDFTPDPDWPVEAGLPPGWDRPSDRWRG